MISAHLTTEQIARCRSRTLPPEELLAVDAHLSGCRECRDLLCREERAGVRLDSLRAGFTRHLEYDEIAGIVDGASVPDAERHVEECAACRAEVEDLRQFRSELKATPRAPVPMPGRERRRKMPALVGFAAALLVALAVSQWMSRRPGSARPSAPVAAQQALPSVPALSPAEREAVQLALQSHKLERAPILDRLVSRRGVLLGAPAEPAGFDLLSPMGTAVMEDRPTLSWKPLPGTTRYAVSIFDENFNKVAESPALTSPSWQPEKPLPRGRIYNWQVSAKIRGRIVRAPVPPAPEARFEVVSAKTADQMETARREHPRDHLLLAVLYAGVGALDNAASELDLLSATDPATAEALRSSLVELRR
jgi:hypothetical protein